MLIPGLIYLVVYKFAPLLGLVIAFKDYNIFLGENPIQAIFLSEWVGLKHYQRLFSDPYFLKVFTNTIIINLYKIAFLFPIPILFAVFLNEARNKVFKKLVQTSVYIPYFFSWVITFGIFYSVLGSYGIINTALKALDLSSIQFFTNPKIFRGILILTEGWKETGWNSIVYLAAITAIDPTLYEAAEVDGAGRFRKIRHITIPCILPSIVLMLIIRIGSILSGGYEQILVMYNAVVYEVADVIQTYVYRMGLGKMEYSLATALGLFNSIIAFIMITLSNKLSKKMLGRGIW
jgi:putative aldouronate transport system permease protein